MLVSEFLEDGAGQFPEKVCLIDGRRRLTYLDLEEQSNRLANALVVLKPAFRLIEQDIIRQVVGRLEGFTVPRSVEFKKALPKSFHGKVAKRDLR